MYTICCSMDKIYAPPSQVTDSFFISHLVQQQQLLMADEHRSKTKVNIFEAIYIQSLASACD
jgi:hypothetical protein